MKKTVLTILCLFMTIPAYALPGSGTQQDPWLIQSLANFQEFAADANYWADHTRLETDVNLAGITYSTAVIAPEGDDAFTGVFDGNDHKITGLTIDDGGVGNRYMGLFGYIYSGHIRNLHLEGVSVNGDDFVGSLVGYNNKGIVTNCYSTGPVDGSRHVGGLIGSNSRGNVSNCYSTSSVSGTGLYVGGLIGSNSRGNVSNCYSTGSVSSFFFYRYIGGLVGSNSGIISNCYSTGSVSSGSKIGGLVGVNGGSVSGCYSNGDVSGYLKVGGLMGENYGSVSNCYSTGSVDGSHVVGGLTGENSDSISNCYSTGPVSGDDKVGGLLGTNTAIVSNCYSTGPVDGDYDIGGLLGINSGIVSNCYSTGSVSGTSNYVGGLVGENYGSVSNCYSTGLVSGDDNVSGLVGYNYDKGTVLNCFWDIQTSGINTSNGGTGKTTAEMMDINTYLNASWDFVGETTNGTDDIWFIRNIDYPKLWWQNQPPVAVAGPDQTAHAWIDGFADVNLDGSSSYDDDVDPLTYLWSWQIGSDIYETNGVTPMIELPVGQHTIELIVNDGIEDSEPNYTTVTVIEPLHSKLWIMPRVINRKSRGRYIIAWLQLPPTITEDDIDDEYALTLYPGEIEASRKFIFTNMRKGLYRTNILAFFDRRELLEAVGDENRVRIEVAGRLNTGRYFYGTRRVLIINRGRRPWRH